MESREEVAALLAAARVAAGAMEFELALRGYMRAFEVTRSAPLLLSAANMHIKLGELDAAANFCAVLQEQMGAHSPAVAVAAKCKRRRLCQPRAACGCPHNTAFLLSPSPRPHPDGAGQLSTEQKTVLAKKEKEITAARALAGKGTVKEPNRRLSAWQQKLDQAEHEKLSK